MQTVVIVETILLVLGIVFLLRAKRKRRENRRREIKLAEEHRTSFISIMSHQLRTPLTIIKGYLESLLTGDRGELNEGQHEYMSEALSINNEMIDLVNDYLNVTQMEKGKVAIHREPVDLAEMVGDVVDEMQTFSRAVNTTLAFRKPASPLPHALVDPIKLRQAIQNILSNALKYSKKGGAATVTIEQKGATLLLTCRDDGVGIPKDQQNELFTKFFRARNVLQRDAKGSGLGLFVAKLFVEASGGRIWLESVEGKGTAVFCSFPIEPYGTKPT